MKAIMLLIFGALLALWVFAMPQAGAAQKKANAPALTGMDRKFASDAATGNMAEVQLGELAQQKGQSDFVKEFGAMMAKDHGSALAELKSLATTKNITLPTALTPAQQATYNKLNSMSGADFDRAYKAAMIKDHEMGIKKFSQYAAKGNDAELRAYAQKALPTKKRHLQILRAGKMPS